MKDESLILEVEQDFGEGMSINMTVVARRVGKKGEGIKPAPGRTARVVLRLRDQGRATRRCFLPEVSHLSFKCACDKCTGLSWQPQAQKNAAVV